LRGLSPIRTALAIGTGGGVLDPSDFHSEKSQSMTHFSKILLVVSSLMLAGVGVLGCGGPAHTSTTTTTSTDHPESGGEVQHRTTETTQTQADGAQTVDHTETTQTTTPAPH
jgi:hypothetical protein